jgi:hypothetical protein
LFVITLNLIFILIELGCTLFPYLGFLTRCEFYLDRFLMGQPLHQLELLKICVVFCVLNLCDVYIPYLNVHLNVKL